MNLFLNLTTRNKLFFTFGLMILLLSCVTATAYRSITAMQSSQEILYSRDFADTVDLMEIRGMNNRVRADILNMMLLSKRSGQEEWHNDLKKSSSDIDKLFQQLLERQREDQTFLTKLKELKTIRDDYVQTRDEQQIPLIYAGKIKEARALGIGIQSERYLKIWALAQELEQSSKQHAERAVAETQRRADESLRLIGIIGIVALSFAVALVLLLTRVIAAPLKEFAGIAERIASGDLSMTLAVNDRIDEVGVLMRMFARMLQSLQEMAGIAKQIAAGDLTVQVKPQSDKDTLGNAFAAMVNNLRK
ncbi:MAG: MCP four helix bundle domain-containing protein, partial [Candidatus Nanopelagicaceae bacterium]|nr:MCP four helix bundle domain-containing protein [Candidatus Nanopelagicaceae bacterium]